MLRTTLQVYAEDYLTSHRPSFHSLLLIPMTADLIGGIRSVVPYDPSQETAATTLERLLNSTASCVPFAITILYVGRVQSM